MDGELIRAPSSSHPGPCHVGARRTLTKCKLVCKVANRSAGGIPCSQQVQVALRAQPTSWRSERLPLEARRSSDHRAGSEHTRARPVTPLTRGNYWRLALVSIGHRRRRSRQGSRRQRRSARWTAGAHQAQQSSRPCHVGARRTLTKCKLVCKAGNPVGGAEFLLTASPSGPSCAAYFLAQRASAP